MNDSVKKFREARHFSTTFPDKYRLEVEILNQSNIYGEPCVEFLWVLYYKSDYGTWKTNDSGYSVTYQGKYTPSNSKTKLPRARLISNIAPELQIDC